MTEYAGDEYGDDLEGSRGTGPGEGKNDEPATTGTHRGWGDPQAEPPGPGGENADDDET